MKWLLVLLAGGLFVAAFITFQEQEVGARTSAPPPAQEVPQPAPQPVYTPSPTPQPPPTPQPEVSKQVGEGEFVVSVNKGHWFDTGIPMTLYSSAHLGSRQSYAKFQASAGGAVVFSGFSFDAFPNTPIFFLNNETSAMVVDQNFKSTLQVKVGDDCDAERMVINVKLQMYEGYRSLPADVLTWREQHLRKLNDSPPVAPSWVNGGPWDGRGPAPNDRDIQHLLIPDEKKP